MISTKLVRMIEDHWESISERLVRRVHRDAELVYLKQLPDAELAASAQEVLQHLDRWLAAGTDRHQMEQRYQVLGRIRCQERVPLHECVRALHLLKNGILGYVRDQGIGHTVVELYAEEELEHHLGAFFDSLVYHLVRGYEGQWHQAVRASTA